MPNSDNEILPPSPEFPGSNGTELRISATYGYSPLPPAEEVAVYERLAPGAAERLLKQFESQGEHRRAIERKIVYGHESRNNLGQLTGILLPVFGTASAIAVLHFFGLNWIATLIAIILIICGFGGPLAAQLIAKNMRLPSAKPPSAAPPPPAS